MSREKLFLIGAILAVAVIAAAGWMGRGQDNQAKQIMENNDLKIEDLKIGDGEQATAGAKITVNYRGTLTDGTEFDSSYKRNQLFSFVLGAGEVIKGWDEGFAGMKVGGRRKLIIPPELGYGSRPAGSIPPNSTLIFEVELVSVD